MQRTSKVAHQYGGHVRDVGEPFEVEPQDVKVLLLLGRIEPIEGEEGYCAPQQTYETRQMTAQPPKRAYNRKAC